VIGEAELAVGSEIFVGSPVGVEAEQGRVFLLVIAVIAGADEDLPVGLNCKSVSPAKGRAYLAGSAPRLPKERSRVPRS